jgi:hypothetical protein
MAFDIQLRDVLRRVAPVFKGERETLINHSLKMLRVGIYEGPLMDDRGGRNQGVRHADSLPLESSALILAPNAMMRSLR